MQGEGAPTFPVKVAERAVPARIQEKREPNDARDRYYTGRFLLNDVGRAPVYRLRLTDLRSRSIRQRLVNVRKLSVD